MDTKEHKKLLILAYDFPPYVSVGGLRPYAWYKYLKEFGVYPIVVTRQWANRYGNHLDYIAPGDSPKTLVEETEHGTIIRTPYQPNLANRLMLKYGDQKWVWLRKLITAFYEFTQWFLLVGQKVNLYFGAKAYLQQNKVDAIIATGDPFILFRYANLLSKKFNVPWVADYRDPWVKDRQNFIFRSFNIYNQKKNVSSVNTLTTVSTFFASIIKTKKFNPNTEIIINGFDGENCKSVISQKHDGFRIAYAGTIYPWHPVYEFLKGIYKFTKESNISIRLDFYGVNIEKELKEFVKKNDIKIVSFFPKVSNRKIFSLLSSKNALLLFNDYSIIGTKIYDYLAVNRKIIFCFSEDAEAKKLKITHFPIDRNKDLKIYPQAELIEETNSGIIVRDQEHLKTVLMELYQEFQEKGFIECNSVEVEKYSRRLQVEKLANIIKEL